MKLSSNNFRRWCRLIHRDLSFVFSGMLIIYAISGIVMNHRDKINPNYSVERSTVTIDKLRLPKEQVSEQVVKDVLAGFNLEKKYTKHYFPEPTQMKVFIKGGSSLVVNLQTGSGTLEVLQPRYVIGPMARLHYNPGKWWTWFADIFAIGLIVIVFSGIFMMKSKQGILGRGGVELLIGIAIPLIFLLFF